MSRSWCDRAPPRLLAVVAPLALAGCCATCGGESDGPVVARDGGVTLGGPRVSAVQLARGHGRWAVAWLRSGGISLPPDLEVRCRGELVVDVFDDALRPAWAAPLSLAEGACDELYGLALHLFATERGFALAVVRGGPVARPESALELVEVSAQEPVIRSRRTVHTEPEVERYVLSTGETLGARLAAQGEPDGTLRFAVSRSGGLVILEARPGRAAATALEIPFAAQRDAASPRRFRRSALHGSLGAPTFVAWSESGFDEREGRVRFAFSADGRRLHHSGTVTTYTQPELGDFVPDLRVLRDARGYSLVVHADARIHERRFDDAGEPAGELRTLFDGASPAAGTDRATRVIYGFQAEQLDGCVVLFTLANRQKLYTCRDDRLRTLSTAYALSLRCADGTCVRGRGGQLDLLRL